MKAIRVLFTIVVLATMPLLLTACPDRTGSLQVTLVPQTAVNAGAQWCADLSGEWHDSGYTIDGLSVGSHWVSFKDVAGWIAPGTLKTSVAANARREITMEYEAASEGEGEGEGELVEVSEPCELTGGIALDIVLSDGTRLNLPATEATGTLTQISLGRAESSPNLDEVDSKSVGAARVVQFDSFDPTEKGISAALVTPQVTFPASIIAGLDKNSIAVYRVADLFIDGTPYPGHASSLPINFAANGDLAVTDFYFPDSIMSDLAFNDARKSGRLASSAKEAILKTNTIQYIVGTFKDSYNWCIKPELLRFYPQADGPTGPGRVSWAELSPARQAEEDGRSVNNIVILLHGHNEEEKLGFERSTAPSPWNYAYKRDVWTQLYKFVTDYGSSFTDCTGFYEFIYPTYLPIFTPCPGVERLDETFAEKVNSLVASEAHVGKTLNLYILAHSMGGVVARAGIQLFEKETHDVFQGLVTWGSPHLGSPLVSLRYVLGAPPGIYRPGPDNVVSFPLENIDNTLFALRRSVDNMQVDAPGTRDFRWANGHTTTPRGLSLDKLFSDSGAPDDLWNRYNLENGTEIYSQNLRLLNENDVYRLSTKYNAFFGVTTRRAKVIFPRGWARPTVDTTGPPLGAKVMPWLVDNADQPYAGYVEGDSDGAVPMVSMAAAGVAGKQTYVGDVDHEQYYGAPDSNGVFQEITMARRTAAQTLDSFKMECPPPGQRIYHFSHSGTTPEQDVNLPYPITVDYSTTMDVTVNFDGSQEPAVYYGDRPTGGFGYTISNPGYVDPITVALAYSFSITPTEGQVDVQDGWGHFRTIYTLKKREFQDKPDMVGNQFPPGFTTDDYNYLASGSGFTWKFTQNPSNPYNPSFSPGPIRLTYTVKVYDLANPDAEPSVEEKTYSCYGSANSNILFFAGGRY